MSGPTANPALRGECTGGTAEPVLLVPAALTELRTHAETVYPEECCGALLGLSGDASPPGTEAARATPGPIPPNAAAPTRRMLLRAIPLPNAWAGRRGDRYLIPAGVVRELEGEARRSGLQVVGFYHSHPDGVAVPSRFDREAAWPWYSYLIIPVRGGAAGSVRSWRLREDRATFVEEQIEVSAAGLEIPAAGEEERCG